MAFKITSYKHNNIRSSEHRRAHEIGEMQETVRRVSTEHMEEGEGVSGIDAMGEGGVVVLWVNQVCEHGSRGHCYGTCVYYEVK